MAEGGSSSTGALFVPGVGSDGQRAFARVIDWRRETARQGVARGTRKVAAFDNSFLGFANVRHSTRAHWGALA